MVCHRGDIGLLMTPLINNPLVVYHGDQKKSMEVTAIMKEKMSVGELRRYFQDHCPNEVFYCTDNQIWDTIDNTVRARLSFTSIVMMCHPNVICLKNGNNTICFEQVKHIYVDTEKSMMGTVLDIVCGCKYAVDIERRYTVIVT